jgi:hypothetical protein
MNQNEKTRLAIIEAGPEPYLETARRAARRYVTPELPVEELVQEGALLFYAAVNDWQPERMRSFAAYYWYRCVGRFAYLKHALYRDWNRFDEPGEDEEPAWVVAPDLEQNPEREAGFREAVGRLSEDAWRVVNLVFDPPRALLGRLNREGLRWYLTRERVLGGTDQNRISAAFNEIGAALAEV